MNTIGYARLGLQFGPKPPHIMTEGTSHKDPILKAITLR